MAFVSPHNRLCGPPSTQRVVDALLQQHNTNTVGVIFELGEFFGGLRSTTIRHFVTTHTMVSIIYNAEQTRANVYSYNIYISILLVSNDY